MKAYFGKGLADCCSDKNVVMSSLSVVENGLVLSEHDEIVWSKFGKVVFFRTRPEGSEGVIGFIGEYEEIRCILRERWP